MATVEQPAQVVNIVSFSVKLRDGLQQLFPGQGPGSGRKGARALTWTSDEYSQCERGRHWSDTPPAPTQAQTPNNLALTEVHSPLL